MLEVLSTLHGSAACGLLFTAVASAGIGAPWAQDVLLLAAAGLSLHPGGLDAVAVAATAWVAILAGDAISVWFGHHYGARWVRRPWAARFVPPQRLPGLEEGMLRHAALLSFVTRFLPGQRATLYFLFGSLRMPWQPFLAADALAALIQVAVAQVGMRSFGWNWPAFVGPVESADNVLTLALVGVLVVWWMGARRGERG
ncbi:DedA family protein [Ramlibacter alkalitolerans]|uniref:VTT domain-containing protein n=1 Tax=Ramlibacter alkalitolerans TaxID=2039631 RepID=A0ABS1JW41_9BURK|nr:VTT domain-containing protein [Ramlibacter alkalitolerans]MBL0428427.1 VTT domain-containing protein [Ramlibacter alkalitolerans]